MRMQRNASDFKGLRSAANNGAVYYHILLYQIEVVVCKRGFMGTGMDKKRSTEGKPEETDSIIYKNRDHVCKSIPNLKTAYE